MNWKKQITLFLTSQAISLFGSSMVQFAIVWYVTKETSSGFWVSMLTVCAYLPQFVISFFAGVWADRHSKKLLIIGADTGITVTTLILILLFPYISKDTTLLMLLLFISALRSIGTGIQTPAVSALIPELVPEQHYMRVNGINATIQSVVQFAAPAAAGLVLTYYSLPITLMLDIITAVIGITVFSFVLLPKKMEEVENGEGSVYQDMLYGIHYAKSDFFIKRLLLTNGFFILLCVPAGFLAGLYVSITYGNSYAYLTTVELVGFAGMTLGGILMGTWGGFKDRLKTLIAGMILFGILAIGMGISKSFVLYLLFMFLYGIALTMIQTATTTLLQESAKPEMQGRVFGLFSAIYSAFLPIGMLIFGPLSDMISMRWIMVLSGVALVILGSLTRSISERR
ncbi:MAG: MFS transporter [Lachnospiraceae bacterium]|nr:MFS transporter [Lachnospiraceae bacterium]